MIYMTHTYHTRSVLQQTCKPVHNSYRDRVPDGRTVADILEDFEVLLSRASARPPGAGCLEPRARFAGCCASDAGQVGQVQCRLCVTRRQLLPRICMRWRRRRADRNGLGGWRRQVGAVQRLFWRSCAAGSRRERVQAQCLTSAILCSLAAVRSALQCQHDVSDLSAADGWWLRLGKEREGDCCWGVSHLVAALCEDPSALFPAHREHTMSKLEVARCRMRGGMWCCSVLVQRADAQLTKLVARTGASFRGCG